MSRFDPDTAIGGSDARFPATRQTLFERVRGDDESERERALEEIVAVYWKPIYKYIRLRWGKGNEEAKDLTQGFFSLILEKESLASFDPSRGTFRTWLRTLVDRFVSNEIKASTRVKRGGGIRMLDFDAAEGELASHAAREASPERFLHQEWIRSVLQISAERLEQELESEGKIAHAKLFREYDLEESSRSYRDLAEELGIPETSVTNWLALARRRFRSIVIDTVRGLTATDEEFRTEVRDLLGVEP